MNLTDFCQNPPLGKSNANQQLIQVQCKDLILQKTSRAVGVGIEQWVMEVERLELRSQQCHLLLAE